MKMAKKKMLKITLIKSMSGRLKNHIACVRGLGFRYLNHTVEVLDTPENRGMVNTISYLIRIET